MTIFLTDWRFLIFLTFVILLACFVIILWFYVIVNLKIVSKVMNKILFSRLTVIVQQAALKATIVDLDHRRRSEDVCNSDWFAEFNNVVFRFTMEWWSHRWD